MIGVTMREKEVRDVGAVLTRPEVDRDGRRADHKARERARTHPNLFIMIFCYLNKSQNVCFF